MGELEDAVADDERDAPKRSVFIECAAAELRAQRKYQDLTVQQLCDLAGVSTNTINRYERQRNNPGDGKLQTFDWLIVIKLAKAMGLHEDDLLAAVWPRYLEQSGAGS